MKCFKTTDTEKLLELIMPKTLTLIRAWLSSLPHVPQNEARRSQLQVNNISINWALKKKSQRHVESFDNTSKRRSFTVRFFFALHPCSNASFRGESEKATLSASLTRTSSMARRNRFPLKHYQTCYAMSV